MEIADRSMAEILVMQRSILPRVPGMGDFGEVMVELVLDQVNLARTRMRSEMVGYLQLAGYSVPGVLDPRPEDLEE
jgi:hypothetical protein